MTPTLRKCESRQDRQKFSRETERKIGDNIGGKGEEKEIVIIEMKFLLSGENQAKIATFS